MIDSLCWARFFEDGLFAAMAAIGFSSISHTPRRIYPVCALAAAAGHSLRFLLMRPESGAMNIIAAGTVAAFVIGCIAVVLAPTVKVPAEACLFPALLPMIPGMYAYRAAEGLLACLGSTDAQSSAAGLATLGYNGLTCSAIVLGMVIGANLPIFMLKKLSFQATR